MIHDVGKRIIGNGIQTKYANTYPHRVIQGVNREEEEAEGQKRRTRTGMMKVLGLSHKRENQSDPRLSGFMFHKIYFIYSDKKNK